MLDLYAHGAFLEKARKSRTLVFLDLDRTLASHNPALTEPAIRKEIRVLLEEMEAVVIFTTARTPEMLMTSRRYEASLKFGFNRMPPHQGLLEDGTRFYVPLELLSEFSGLLDPDIIHSCGAGILGKYEDGYLPDALFNDFPGTSWRAPRLAVIHDIDNGTGTIASHMPLIEDMNNYVRGKSDATPLPYRIQFDFSGEGALDRKVYVKQLIREALRIYPTLYRRTKFVDESRPSEGKFCFYLLARKKTKEAALGHMVRQISRAAGINSSELNVFVAGDALTDLPSMFAGPGDCNFVYGLPSKAPVTANLCYGDTKARFAGELLNRFTRRLSRTDDMPPGHFWFKSPAHQKRRLIAGDIAYPETTSAESVLAQLAFFKETIR